MKDPIYLNSTLLASNCFNVSFFQITMRQYANSPTIQQLIQNLSFYFSSKRAEDDFYQKIWNVDTAIGYGLDIWGRIVGIGRYLDIDPESKIFGFENETRSFGTFNEAPFKNGEPLTTTYRLNDRAYRKLILIKAMTNIVRPNAPTLNQMIHYLFDGRRCYVRDLGGMQMEWMFNFTLEPYERSILKSNALPRPAGVLVHVVEIPVSDIFGFEESGEPYTGFDEGTFFSKERQWQLQNS